MHDKYIYTCNNLADSSVVYRSGSVCIEQEGVAPVVYLPQVCTLYINNELYMLTIVL